MGVRTTSGSEARALLRVFMERYRRLFVATASLTLILVACGPAATHSAGKATSTAGPTSSVDGGPTAFSSPAATSAPTATAIAKAKAPMPKPKHTPTPAPAGTRNKFLWPFASTSIWNMPIGRGAVYVPAHIALPTLQTLTADQDIIVMDPTAPMVLLAHSGAGWSGGNRCTVSGPTLTSVPIPATFTVSSNGHNDALAVLMPDGQTVIQAQPFARCTPAGPATALALAPADNLYTNGILGAHGGSGLSSLGGTLRLNELVPGGQIRHALKVNLDAAADLYPSPGYRWPAIRA